MTNELAETTVQRDEWKRIAEDRGIELERLRADISQAYDLRDKAEGRYCTALGAIEQLHAAVKTAQELAATRLMEIERLSKREKTLMDVIDSRDRALGFVPLDDALHPGPSISKAFANSPRRVSHEPLPCADPGWEIREGKATCKGCGKTAEQVFGASRDAPSESQKMMAAGYASRRIPREDFSKGASRDADHCDYPDCEQHWTHVVAQARALLEPLAEHDPAIRQWLKTPDLPSLTQGASRDASSEKSETVKDSCGPGCAMGANRPAQTSDEIRDLACCDKFVRESASEFCATCGYTNLDHLRKRSSSRTNSVETFPEVK